MLKQKVKTMSKYVPYPQISIENRSWADKRITKAPVWCSVDLRDGNQALANPMDPIEKLNWFNMLTRIGFREIEVSFPSASRQDFDFTRMLIDRNYIPENVTIQVLTQARQDLIRKTFDALHGVRRAILHVYNSTSPAQREMVFGKSKKEIIKIAVDGVRYARELAKNSKSEIILQYSPESFSQTELSFASEICHAVIETWSPQENEPVIINLPATVEAAPPHVYADQIEYMAREFDAIKNIIISVHTHNDRGCAVAAAELAQCAGAVRVEGTLFGNGERTGNADLITLALNLFTQGIDSNLDFSDLPEISRLYHECTRMSVPPRQPYSGELVFTAFSGSHQDAISKSLKHFQSHGGTWGIPYIPIDPQDIGRHNESIIRINGQSGKGGVAYILEHFHGLTPPKEMHIELGECIKNATSCSNTELSIQEIGSIVKNTFFEVTGPFKVLGDMVSFDKSSTGMIERNASNILKIRTPLGEVEISDQADDFNTITNNIVASINKKRENKSPIQVTMCIKDQHQSECTTVYTQLGYGTLHKSGAGTDHNPISAAIKALCSALNRFESLTNIN
jgi:2-isopropylmalate synthase